MDQLDEKIIAALRKDSRTSFVKIAKQLGLTEGAVRARVKRLIKQKIIEGFTIDVKDSTRAVVMVATSQAVPTAHVSQAIRNVGAERVYEVSGSYDIICFVQAGSISELNTMIEKIRALNGVVDTSTSMVLQ